MIGLKKLLIIHGPNMNLLRIRWSEENKRSDKLIVVDRFLTEVVGKMNIFWKRDRI